jgi:hypothetical protein
MNYFRLFFFFFFFLLLSTTSVLAQSQAELNICRAQCPAQVEVTLMVPVGTLSITPKQGDPTTVVVEVVSSTTVYTVEIPLARGYEVYRHTASGRFIAQQGAGVRGPGGFLTFARREHDRPNHQLTLANLAQFVSVAWVMERTTNRVLRLDWNERPTTLVRGDGRVDSVRREVEAVALASSGRGGSPEPSCNCDGYYAIMPPTAITWRVVRR